MQKQYNSYSLYSLIIEIITTSPCYSKYLQNRSTFVNTKEIDFTKSKTKRDNALNSLIVLFFETCFKIANKCRKINPRKGTLNSVQKNDLIKAFVFFEDIIRAEINGPESLIQKFNSKSLKFFKDFNLGSFNKVSKGFDLFSEKISYVEESTQEDTYIASNSKVYQKDPITNEWKNIGFQNKKREDGLLKRLREDPETAVAYLNDLLQDKDKGLFLSGLSECVKANGGFTVLAQKTGIKREALYRALSEGGNPKLTTLDNVLQSLGYNIKLVTPSNRV